VAKSSMIIEALVRGLPYGVQPWIAISYPMRTL
jgi:hypothetical protein